MSRHGTVGLDATIGAADAQGTKPLQPDSVYSLFSLTKAFVNVLILAAVDAGRIALTTRVADIIPEFTGMPRDAVTVYHLLTHTTGMPGVWTPRPGMYEDDLSELVAAVCERVHGAVPPGERCDFAPVANHVLMGEILRRTDPEGRDFGTILQDDLFAPLGMTSTSMGVRPDLADRKVVPDTRGIIPIEVKGRAKPGPYSLFEVESNEAAHVGACSSVADIWTFAEMLRCGGSTGTARTLSPRILDMATRNHTGDLPNELYRAVALRAGWTPPPAYIGLGFSVWGPRLVHHQFGTMTSERTFGNYGAGSTMFWVDPEFGVTFVCLTTGLLPQAQNIERFQRLSDLAMAAVA